MPTSRLAIWLTSVSRFGLDTFRNLAAPSGGLPVLHLRGSFHDDSDRTSWKVRSCRTAVTWLNRKLGEGGMGSVYRAVDRNIDTDVVIKIPRAAMMEDPEFAARFTREIRSLVKLSHPHIVKVTDVGMWEGTPFAVMQFLPGRKS